MVTSVPIVGIGDGHGVTITSAQERSIKWTNHRQATLDLCTAIFRRETLAASSLTENPGPSGTSKPKLAPNKVAAVIGMKHIHVLLHCAIGNSVRYGMSLCT